VRFISRDTGDFPFFLALHALPPQAEAKEKPSLRRALLRVLSALTPRLWRFAPPPGGDPHDECAGAVLGAVGVISAPVWRSFPSPSHSIRALYVFLAEWDKKEKAIAARGRQ
jgi:hypothetical protein